MKIKYDGKQCVLIIKWLSKGALQHYHNLQIKPSRGVLKILKILYF